MAETVKHSTQLKLVAGFADDDDRTISVDDPKDGITTEQIKTIEKDAAEVLIGDKTGAPFTGWKDARIVETTSTIFNISN